MGRVRKLTGKRNREKARRFPLIRCRRAMLDLPLRISRGQSVQRPILEREREREREIEDEVDRCQGIGRGRLSMRLER
jgi:hypothetical protein